MLVFLLVFELVIISYLGYRMIKEKSILVKSNSYLSIPQTILIFLLYVYGTYQINHQDDFFSYVSCIPKSLEAFVFKYEKDILLVNFENGLFLTIFLIFFIVNAYLTFNFILVFFLSALKRLIRFFQFRNTGFDVVLGFNPSFYSYARSYRRVFLMVDKLTKEEKECFIKAKINYIIKPYNENSLKWIMKKTNRIVNFLYLGNNSNEVLFFSELLNSFITKNSQYLNRCYFYCNEEETSILENLYPFKNELSPRFIPFNRHEIMANRFAFEHPFTEYMTEKEIDYKTGTIKDINLNMVFIGFGKVNQSLYLSSYANNAFLDADIMEKHVCYYAFDKDDNEYNKKFNFDFLFPEKKEKNCFEKPNLPKPLQFREMDIYSDEFLKEIFEICEESFSNIVISYDNDSNNLDLAFNLKKVLLNRGINKFHIYVRIVDNHFQLDNHFNDEYISTFGNILDVISHKAIINDEVNILARIRANKYIMAKSDSEFDKALCEWNKLSVIKRKSNMASAISIKMKLNLIGLDISEEDHGFSKDEFTKYLKLKDYNYLTYDFKEKSIDNVLGIIEHNRWVQFYISQGYRQMSKDHISVSMKDGKYSLIKDDDILRQHACITSISGIDDYHRYLAESLYQLDNSKSIDEWLCSVETYKYDYNFMEDIYDSLREAGLYIVKRNDYLKVIEAKNFDLVYLSYRYDFPICEQKSYQTVKYLLKKDKYTLLLAKEKEIKAYILGIKGEDFLWMDYLAVFEKYRNQRVGKRFLRLVLERYHTIVFECDKWDGIEGSQTQKRWLFYQSLGAKVINIPYELPTYEGSLPMNLCIISDSLVDADKLREFVRSCILTIHADNPNAKNVLNKYIDKITKEVL